MTGKTIDEEVVGDRAELTCAINADLVASFVTISVTFGWAGSPQPISTRRGAWSAARPTAWMSGKFSVRSSAPTMVRKLAPCRVDDESTVGKGREEGGADE